MKSMQPIKTAGQTATRDLTATTPVADSPEATARNATRKTLGSAIAVAFGLLLPTALPMPDAHAAVVLDQYYLPDNYVSYGGFSKELSSGGSFGRSQVFTVGISGPLDSIAIRTECGVMDTDAVLRLLATDGSGAPIGGADDSTVLLTSSAKTALGDKLFLFDVSASAFEVAVDETYAIEIFSLTGQWTYGGLPDYTGGTSYFFNTAGSIDDWTALSSVFNFATYVGTREDLPAPATALLVGPPLAVGAFVRYRRKRASL